MKKILIGLLSIIAFGCKQKPKQEATVKTNADTTNFFQVNAFLQSQINEVEKTPYFIYKILIENGKRDSVVIDNQQFKILADQFLKPDINDASIKKYYTENVFHDQTTKSYSLSYTTANKELELQNVDVLLKDDAKTVNRIFVRKFYNSPDSSAIEQLSWKPGQSFNVNRLIQRPDHTETSRQTIVVWNEHE